MADDRKLTLYHAPNTRSSASLILLTELEAPHNLKILNMKAGEQRQPPFLAINPLGKVPTLTHGDAVITEQVACFIYLADLFPAKNLAPAIDDPLRGPYLRWMVYYAASFEPALIDFFMKREPAPASSSPYGDYDSMIDALDAQIGKAPYILGDRFSAADVLWGTALAWTMAFKIVPERPAFVEYRDRLNARPAFVKIKQDDAELAAKQSE